MADLFISYAREDRPFAERLAHALVERGWSVWWDRTIPTGKTFDAVIEEAIDAAKCVIVLWSRVSVEKEWVRTEAQEGASRGILLPVLMESGVKIPLAFRRIQAADLAGWSGGDARAFQTLVADITSLIGPPEGTRHYSKPEEPTAARKLTPAEPSARTQRTEPLFPRIARWRTWIVAVGLPLLVAAVLLTLNKGERGSNVPTGPSMRPTATLEADRSSIRRGESTVLTWRTTNASEVRLEPLSGTFREEGSREVTPSRDLTYRLVAKGKDGTAVDSVRITVTGPPPVVGPTLTKSKPLVRRVAPGAGDIAYAIYSDSSVRIRNELTASEGIVIPRGCCAFSRLSAISFSPNNRNVYFGSRMVLRAGDGKEWTRLSPDLTAGTSTPFSIISAIDIPPSGGRAEDDVIWAGVADGRLYVTQDGGKTWLDRSISRSTHSRRTIIEASRLEQGRAYVAFDKGDGAPHLYWTTDYGLTWRELSRGLQGSVMWVREEDRDALVVRTDRGAFRTSDEGKTWTQMP